MSLAGRARRDQIIGAAAEVVAEVGYANTSTARIAKRAGISKGVITYHFDSKDEIMRSVALRLFERCAEEVDKRAEGATDARQHVHALIRTELEFFAAHRTHYLAMTDIMANHREPDFSRAFDAEVERETRRFAQILAAGQRRGEFRPFDSDGVAEIILHCKTAALDVWARKPDLDLPAHIDTLLDFIDHAIMPQADREPSAVTSATAG